MIYEGKRVRFPTLSKAGIQFSSNVCETQMRLDGGLRTQLCLNMLRIFACIFLPQTAFFSPDLTPGQQISTLSTFHEALNVEQDALREIIETCERFPDMFLTFLSSGALVALIFISQVNSRSHKLGCCCGSRHTFCEMVMAGYRQGDV